MTQDGPSLLELLEEMPTGDCWDDAELWPIYEYVRGSKHLRLPDAYRPLLVSLGKSSSAATMASWCVQQFVIYDINTWQGLQKKRWLLGGKTPNLKKMKIPKQSVCNFLVILGKPIRA